jgi:hypothetical protein
MAISKISNVFISTIGCWTPINTGLKKINEIIDYISNGSLVLSTQTFTQQTSLATAVPTTGSSGKIVTVDPTSADIEGQAYFTFSMQNPLITTSSNIQATIRYNPGGSAGIPVVTVSAQNNGNCTFKVYNAIATGQPFNITLTINYLIIN